MENYMAINVSSFAFALLADLVIFVELTLNIS